MIEIPLSPQEFAAKARKLEQEQGIHLPGERGEITKSGVKAAYHFDEGLLKISILEKPFFVSTEFCEDQLRHWLAGS